MYCEKVKGLLQMIKTKKPGKAVNLFGLLCGCLL